MESRKNLKSILLSLLVMALWGSLFPMIKIGYNAFNINSSNIPDILTFAGMRFLVCGVVVIFIALIKKEKISNPKGKNIGLILISGIFSIILHYAFTYIGLSTSDSSKTALLKQLGVLLYVCFAFLFIKSESFSFYKIFGAVIGFAGIIAINFSGNGIHFTVGDIFIIAASVCTVVSGIITKAIAHNSPFWIVGISQFAGGIVLLISGLILGSNSFVFSPVSTLVFLYICIASSVAYTLWNHLLKTAALSNMFIIKFAEPFFACIFGALLLGENIFKIQYLLAFILISTGIILGNKTAKGSLK